MMPLRDLNLLTVFDTLYEQRSVTLAAARLGLTQSAVSHALRRLRETLDDPLFVRAGKILQPTARATEMAVGVRDGLRRLQAALARDAFEPARTQRSFTIAAGSYFCALLVPQLIARVRSLAPGVVIRIVPIDEGLLAALDDGTVDLALGAFERVPARLVTGPLFREELVWIAAAGSVHALRSLTRDDVARLPRLQVGPPRPFGTPDAVRASGPLASRAVSDTLNRRGGDESRVQGVVYDAATAVGTVADTDLVALVPRRVAEAAAEQSRVAILDVAETPATLDLCMLWHRSHASDAGLVWLRAQIAAPDQRA